LKNSTVVAIPIRSAASKMSLDLIDVTCPKKLV
jgi:hypothetical protein